MSTAKAPAAPSGRICEKHGKNKKNNIDEYLSMLDYQSGQPYESTQQI